MPGNARLAAMRHFREPPVSRRHCAGSIFQFPCAASDTAGYCPMH
ncbi:hypothetical protein BSIN_5350 [Burkholderia singularis]|uniref:Uncharacterized protein n=1 Tax=Burkholderia singularis TaxID=1503053 RepID=A0A238GY92_9BURK|nr:hypothetical protein BSIN_5350 [Burkholderia singularis]